MNAKLPYLSSPGSVKSALERIRSAATPDRVTGDFVKTVLLIKGGTGNTIAPFLKRIGFVASDGAPTNLYRQFRNPDNGGVAVAAAIKHGFSELLKANEYFYKLGEKELQALIVQVTGLDAKNRVVALTLSTLKALLAFADFDAPQNSTAAPAVQANSSQAVKVSEAVPSKVGLNLSYTINLNLPATSDQAVFNAIFRSLKEHLLSGDE